MSVWCANISKSPEAKHIQKTYTEVDVSQGVALKFGEIQTWFTIPIHGNQSSLKKLSEPIVIVGKPSFCIPTPKA